MRVIHSCSLIAAVLRLPVAVLVPVAGLPKPLQCPLERPEPYRIAERQVDDGSCCEAHHHIVAESWRMAGVLNLESWIGVVPSGVSSADFHDWNGPCVR